MSLVPEEENQELERERSRACTVYYIKSEFRKISGASNVTGADAPP